MWDKLAIQKAPLKPVPTTAGRTRGLLSTEPTEVVTATGQKRNGNLCYTLRPVQEWITAHYDRHLEQLEMAAARQNAAAMQDDYSGL